MIVVADTGPIIALAKLDRLELFDLFEAPVLIPPRVRRELLSKPEVETREIEQALVHIQEVSCASQGARHSEEADRRPKNRSESGVSALFWEIFRLRLRSAQDDLITKGIG